MSQPGRRPDSTNTGESRETGAGTRFVNASCNAKDEGKKRQTTVPMPFSM
jgi:hypothetical protein